ncbi:MAG: hypothetical protein K8M05_40480 [Deltaproteobacteria bacterium]|nr:hypothetical protein [Kofleriaceae bacterium]
MVYVPDDAPPLAVYCAPYGGLGLKTKSYAKALARIRGLLAIAEEVVHATAELSVLEPASRALVEAVTGRPIERDTASVGCGSRTVDTAGAVAAQGHVHDALAGEAWRRFGAPNAVGARQQTRTGVFHVEWRWLVEDVAEAPERLDAWSPFVEANDHLMYDDYATMVEVRSVWDLRLRLRDGLVTDPYPPSQVHAHLRGKHASAFLGLVLPHESASEGFLADYQIVNRALGMTVPMKGYKLCAPKKRGGGRVYRRLPGL